MSAKILDGKKISSRLKIELEEEIKFHLERGFRRPKLCVIFAGNDFSSEKYVENKLKSAKKIGAEVDFVKLDDKVTYKKIKEIILLKNDDPSIDGILVQFPLPNNISKRQIMFLVNKHKDADGLNPWNMGCLMQDNIVEVCACTPKGVIELLNEYGIKLKGKHVVIVGRSQIVGRPMAIMALNEKATVTITHRYTKDLAKYTRQADVLITAVGKPKLITEDMVKDKVVVIDIGITRNNENKLCGDVDFEGVSKKASWITPVPGGIGPMTVAMLMTNLFELYEKNYLSKQNKKV